MKQNHHNLTAAVVTLVAAAALAIAVAFMVLTAVIAQWLTAALTATAAWKQLMPLPAQP
jgi:hypothetical protein